MQRCIILIILAISGTSFVAWQMSFEKCYSRYIFFIFLPLLAFCFTVSLLHSFVSMSLPIRSTTVICAIQFVFHQTHHQHHHDIDVTQIK